MRCGSNSSKDMSMVTRQLARLVLVTAAALAPMAVSAQTKTRVERAPSDEFFIVSSVDLSKNQLLLKRPTEVTDVMRVDGTTRYLGEDGKPVGLSDLRAGDTVYIRSKPGTGGSVAIEIRKGPMTVAELRRRYLRPRR
jgi:hypothetical protein